MRFCNTIPINIFKGFISKIGKNTYLYHFDFSMNDEYFDNFSNKV